MIDAFILYSRYLDVSFNINIIYFEKMLHRINPTDFPLIKANSSDTDGPFLDLNLSIVQFLLNFMTKGVILISI